MSKTIIICCAEEESFIKVFSRLCLKVHVILALNRGYKGEKFSLISK